MVVMRINPISLIRKTSLYLTKYHAMKMYGALKVQLHAFLTLALDGFMPWLLYLWEKSPQYPTDRWLGESMS
jgi:hypothetical protein